MPRDAQRLINWPSLQSGRSNDCNPAVSLASSFNGISVWELQFPFNRLEARLIAQRIHERVNFHILYARVR